MTFTLRRAPRNGSQRPRGPAAQTKKSDDSYLLYHHLDAHPGLSAGVDSLGRVDRQEVLRHRHPRIRLEERRGDQHAARAGAPGRAARLRARHAQGLRRRDDHRPDEVRQRLRRGRQRELVLRPALRGRLRRRAGPHIPRFRRLPRRQGGRHARGGHHGGQRPAGAALLRRVVPGADDHPLRLALVDDGRLLLPHLHAHLAEGQPRVALRRLLVRHRRAADLHPPQEHRAAARRHRIEDLHLAAAPCPPSAQRTDSAHRRHAAADAPPPTSSADLPAGASRPRRRRGKAAEADRRKTGDRPQDGAAARQSAAPDTPHRPAPRPGPAGTPAQRRPGSVPEPTHIRPTPNHHAPCYRRI